MKVVPKVVYYKFVHWSLCKFRHVYGLKCVFIQRGELLKYAQRKQLLLLHLLGTDLDLTLFMKVVCFEVFYKFHI